MDNGAIIGLLFSQVNFCSRFLFAEGFQFSTIVFNSLFVVVLHSIEVSFVDAIVYKSTFVRYRIGLFFKGQREANIKEYTYMLFILLGHGLFKSHF